MARGRLLCLLLVAALSGCASAATTSGVDEQTVSTSPDDCIEIVVSSSAAPPEDVRTVATEVVRGTFDGYGPSRWNTPDCHRPSKLEAQQKPARLTSALLTLFYGSKALASTPATCSIRPSRRGNSARRSATTPSIASGSIASIWPVAIDSTNEAKSSRLRR